MKLGFWLLTVFSGLTGLTIEQLVRIYNMGYNAGHNDTVEGDDSPAHNSEMDTHHEDIVLEILDDLRDENAG